MLVYLGGQQMEIAEKNDYVKKTYSKPECSSVSLENEGALVEFCNDRPFNVQELKDIVRQVYEEYK